MLFLVIVFSQETIETLGGGGHNFYSSWRPILNALSVLLNIFCNTYFLHKRV